MTTDDLRQRLIETNRQMRADAMQDPMIERIGKLKSFVLGSTSQKVAQLAECSCLTVK